METLVILGDYPFDNYNLDCGISLMRNQRQHSLEGFDFDAPAQRQTNMKRFRANDLRNKMKNAGRDIVVFLDGFFDFFFSVGFVVASAIIDLLFGTLGLGMSFQYNIQVQGLILQSLFAASMMSLFTSGLQIFVMRRWTKLQARVKWWQWLIIGGMLVGDTFVDLSTPGWLMYGENILTVNFVDKPLGYYIVMLITGLMCAFSETLMVHFTEIYASEK